MDKKPFLFPEDYQPSAPAAEPTAPTVATVTAFLRNVLNGKPLEWQKAIELVISKYGINWEKAEALVAEVDNLWNPPSAEPQKEPLGEGG